MHPVKIPICVTDWLIFSNTKCLLLFTCTFTVFDAGNGYPIQFCLKFHKRSPTLEFSPMSGVIFIHITLRSKILIYPNKPVTGSTAADRPATELTDFQINMNG